MAAAGGDTVVPTNWTGLVLTTVAVAIIAAATYFGFGMVLGDADGKTEESHQETTLQDLYSSNARRGIEAMETVRVLPRTALAPSVSLDAPAAASGDADANADDADEQNMDAADAADDAAEEAELAEAAAAAKEQAARLAEAAAAEAARKAAQVEDKAREIAAQAAEKARAAKTAASDMLSSAGETLDTRYRATTTALRAWWNDLKGSDLNIRFIGPLDSTVADNGLAVLFDQPVNAATATSFITLTNSAGAVVTTNWKNGQNPNLIYAAGLKSGRYRLQLEEGLPSSNGMRLNTSLSGDAFVN